MNISNETKKILNDVNLIEQRDVWFQRLQNLFDKKSDEFNNTTVMAVDGIMGSPKTSNTIHEDPERWVVECLDDLAKRIKENDGSNIFRPPCIEYNIYGVHFIDKIFGCEVFFQDGQWYNRQLTTEVGSLVQPDLDKDETWQQAKRAALEFIRQDVALPVFGLPTIASALVSAVNLYGEEILVSLMTESEKAMRDLKIINDTLCQIHEWYRNTLPKAQLQPVIAVQRTQPPGYGQICGCTSQLVSGQIYQDIVAPLDDALLATYPSGGMVHLCGTHEHIIPMLRGMKHLKSVQLNDRASLDLEKYYTGLREDQIIYFMSCAGMTNEQAIELTGGKRLVIIGTPDCSTVKS